MNIIMAYLENTILNQTILERFLKDLLVSWLILLMLDLEKKFNSDQRS